MSSHQSIPRRPRTPSPSSGGRAPQDDTQLEAPRIQTEHDYDIHQGLTDSPAQRDYDPPRAGSIGSLAPMSSYGYEPSSAMNARTAMYSIHGPQTASTESGFSIANSTTSNNTTTTTTNMTNNPFNFTPVQYTAGATGGSVGKSGAMGKRRGHQYRHSSIHVTAMDSIFKPPPQLRTPLAVPAVLPMPTRTEAWWSMTREQTLRLAWCACHFLAAAYVQYRGAAGEASLAMTALSRLVLFDAAGATTCVVVDVMGNFEVWTRSSLKHPFGLERADVLAGFGMAVFIAFMGLDVISHALQHALENLGHHVAHSPHHHGAIHPRDVHVAAGLAIVSTLVSAVGLKNHARVGKAMRLELIAGWGRILGNPSHFLTLSCSLLVLLLPLLSLEVAFAWADKSLAVVVAALMIALGARLATTLASMLLMSFTPPGPRGADAVRRVVRDLAVADSAVARVDEARFWQVHYGLCMANLKLRYRISAAGAAEDVVRIRQKVTNLIRQRFAGLNWDVSVQLAVERD